MILTSIVDIASICAKKGIKEAILSPGSRCAPITLAFVRHPEIHCRVIPDERSAAFVALGMAQQLGKPVALVCTSGSAALNYAPAVAEAFFQHIPLLLFTADRPPEWIDQWDGQTIRQEGLYGKHVKGSYTFPDLAAHPDKEWHGHRMINEAINLSMDFPQGPVHVNVPIREPFYPSQLESMDFDKDLKIFNLIQGQKLLNQDEEVKLGNKLKSFNKVLILPGQQRPSASIREALVKLSKSQQAVVIGEAIGNQFHAHTIRHHDLILNGLPDTTPLLPDLVISFGKSILSKGLKNWLRASKASHWHLQEGTQVPDTFQHLEKIIAVTPAHFLQFLTQNLDKAPADFYHTWWQAEKEVSQNLPSLMDNMEFGEMKTVHRLMEFIPTPSKLHVANSMPVRYVSYLGNLPTGVEVIANRGTSGIDGSNSTAVGCVFTTKEPVTLLTGDMAFFYDRNAFWHQYNLPNLRIVVLNNHAGGIFRMIDGPAQLPELEEYFETTQSLVAGHLAGEFGFEYHRVAKEEELAELLPTFYKKSIRPKVLEVISKSKINAEVFKRVKAEVKSKLVEFSR
ncbi:2-succinyl-5-enolpyruvyl-6-hydroxy-3-cyclohexene-1-carboxylic-acid synthase [Pleomorphovibrio marinus]|uniref:2-succinyl-5-enolpyruvyl-6-hydroxy-3- cyclohexene-1-carboxylic-acid synthase n=1 Tax=Pleomorphovibrio marinus TaxID=2164132 RepID=UPI000E0C3D81|nr:2-succinyl-5-enolpyruvyl-6-hydroxy-3-cyclohexene-1-carboxylic-acid synthase [Pleomorphovibrio marinus]